MKMLGQLSTKKLKKRIVSLENTHQKLETELLKIEGDLTSNYDARAKSIKVRKLHIKDEIAYIESILKLREETASEAASKIELEDIVEAEFIIVQDTPEGEVEVACDDTDDGGYEFPWEDDNVSPETLAAMSFTGSKFT